MNEPFEFGPGRPSWRSMALSFTLHAILLTLFVLFWKSDALTPKADTVRTVDLVLADVSADSTVQYLEQLPAADSQPEKLTGDLQDLLPLTQPAPNPTAVAAPSPAAATGLPNLDAGAMIQPTGSSGFAAGGGRELTADELKQIAAERQRMESLLPRGEPATIRVFGSGGLVGRKFVFLIDRSKSMGEEGLGVLERANAELQSALSQLTPDHQFQVVGYHHETTMVEKRALLSATAENRQKVGEFIQNLAAFGGTEHESGLIAALTLKPDVIVLMTDGGLPEMNAGQLSTVRRIAGKSTQIHCIQFGHGPAPSSTFMTTLAQENRGTYKYIDVAKWK